MRKILFYNKFISCLYMFRAHVLIISRSKLYYTACGIIISVGGRPVHRLREVLSQPVHRTATYRCDDTRDCIIQFWPPDDEHMCSKHVDAWSKLTLKQKILCIKLVNYWDARSAKRQHFQHLLRNTTKVRGANVSSASSYRTCIMLLLLQTAGNYKFENIRGAPVTQNSYKN